jgi:hypothetical protein
LALSIAPVLPLMFCRYDFCQHELKPIRKSLRHSWQNWENEREHGRIYLTGGATALLYGWRSTTIDVDLKANPEPTTIRMVRRYRSCNAGTTAMNESETAAGFDSSAPICDCRRIPRTRCNSRRWAVFDQRSQTRGEL